MISTEQLREQNVQAAKGGRRVSTRQQIWTVRNSKTYIKKTSRTMIAYVIAFC